MTKVFLSYSRKDRAFALRLARELTSLGIDTRDDSRIALGDNRADQIRDALRTSDGFVFVLSPAALNSASAMIELGAATALGKKVLAVQLANGGLPEPLPAPVKSTQILQAEGMTEDEIATTLGERLAA